MPRRMSVRPTANHTRTPDGTGIVGVPGFDKQRQHRNIYARIDDHTPPVRQHDLNAPRRRGHRRPNLGHHNRRHKAGLSGLRRVLPTGAAPSEQQRCRKTVTASSRRHQPRSTEALGDDPKLLLFGPSSPAARIDHLKPFDLRTVRMTGHTHCLQRSPRKAVHAGG